MLQTVKNIVVNYQNRFNISKNKLAFFLVLINISLLAIVGLIGFQNKLHVWADNNVSITCSGPDGSVRSGLIIAHRFPSIEACVACRDNGQCGGTDPAGLVGQFPACGKTASCINTGSCTVKTDNPNKDGSCSFNAGIPSCSVYQYDCLNGVYPNASIIGGNIQFNCNDCESNLPTFTPTPTKKPTPTITPTNTLTPTPTPYHRRKPKLTLTPTPTPGPVSPVCDSLSASVTSGLVPLTVNFTVYAHGQSYSISTYRFDFGDGNIQNSGSNYVTHIYGNSGTYQVVVTVIDSAGWTGNSDKCRVIINPYLANVTPPPQQPKAGTGTILTFGLILSLVLGIILRNKKSFLKLIASAF